MIYSFTIPGRLPGLNEYIEAERSHRIKGANMKAEYERLICRCIRIQLGKVQITKPIRLDYHFFEPDKRRDKDNISGYAHKLIQDSLVKCRVLKNDGWREIADYRDYFAVDKSNPRVEVIMTTEGENDGERISCGASALERGCDGGRSADRVDEGRR